MRKDEFIAFTGLFFPVFDIQIYYPTIVNIMGFPRGSLVKTPPANAGDTGDLGYIPGLGRFPWRRKHQPTPLFLPGKSQGEGAYQGTGHGDAKSGTRLSTGTSQQ